MIYRKPVLATSRAPSAPPVLGWPLPPFNMSWRPAAGTLAGTRPYLAATRTVLWRSTEGERRHVGHGLGGAPRSRRKLTNVLLSNTL